MIFNLDHFGKHPFKESFKNLSNIIKAIKHYSKGGHDRVSAPTNYRIVLEDFFTEVNTRTWHIGQPWGEFHINYLHQYYGTTDEFVHLHDDGLALEVLNKPKTWIKNELPDWQQSPNLPDKFTIPVGIGLIHSNESWQYGWFEAWVKLPIGKPYWPAFWLTGANSWPPEIDIFEAYSNETPKYGKKMFGGLSTKEDWKIQPNLHYGVVEDGTKKQYRSYNAPVKDCTHRFVQYACHWEKDFIRIYYDGILVFECVDPSVLKWYSGEKDKMNIIINHGLMEHQPIKPDENPLIIRCVRVLQKR